MDCLPLLDRFGWHYLTSKILIRRFLRPTFFARPPAEQAYWNQGQKIEFPSDAEGRIYLPSGSSRNEWIVMIHGWSGRGSQFNEIVPVLLEQGYSVLLMDCLGHSEKSSRKRPLTHLWAFTNALKADLEFFGKPVHCLVGHSFGGCAAALLAEHFSIPQRIFLIGSPNRIDKVTQRFAKHFKVSDKGYRAFVTELEKRAGKLQSDLDPAGRVAKLSIPVGLMHDRDDKEVPFEEGQAVVAAGNGVQFFPTQGLGHRRILRSPELAQAIITFLERT